MTRSTLPLSAIRFRGLRPHGPVAVASILAVLLLTPVGGRSVLADGTLDQQAPPNTALAYSYIFTMGQTFTAGITGTLDTVALYGSGGTWNVAIRNVAGGVPSGPALATGSAPATGGWVQIALTPEVAVTSGATYAITVAGSTPFWNAAAADYPGGTGLFGTTPFVLDFAFQTFVTPPPPPPPPAEPPEPPIMDLIVASAVGTAEAGPFTGSVSVEAGSTVWRRVTVTNGSGTSLGALAISDTAGPLPATCPMVPESLAIGESWTCTFSQSAPAGTTTYVTSATGGSVWGNVSGGAPATISGTVPVALAAETVGSKLGLAASTGAYTGSTKVARIGTYVTWRANLGAAASGKTVGVFVARRASDGSWGAWTRQTGRIADAMGTIVYSRRDAPPSWLSVRFSVDGVSLTRATQARWR